MMSLPFESLSGDGKGYHFALAIQEMKKFRHFIQELMQFEKKGLRFLDTLYMFALILVHFVNDFSQWYH